LGKLHRTLLSRRFSPSRTTLAFEVLSSQARDAFSRFLMYPLLTSIVPLFHGEGSGDPSPVRARPLRDRSLNSPSQQKPQGFPQRLPYATSPANLCPPPFPAQIRESVAPSRSIYATPRSATGLRLRLRPAAPLSGGVDESLKRLRTTSLRPRSAPTRVGTPRATTAPPKAWQPLLSFRG